MRCAYCYIEENAENGKMDNELLAQTIERVSNFAKKSHWIWHGGEPLLMGVDFYRTIKDIQDFYGQRGASFSNGIQTNATLINRDLLNFSQETGDFRIGMSIDGPQNLHDSTRVYPDGTGSFDRVMAGIDLVKQYRGSAGAICVVSAKNVDSPEELYNFFRDTKIHVKFNPLIKSGRALENMSELGITPRQYGDFLSKLWQVYENDSLKLGETPIDVDPFLEIIGNLETERPLGCNYSATCRDSFISIGPNGDIYPCGRFDGIKQFWMGNVQTHTIEEAVESEANQSLRGRNLETVSGCKTCDFGKVCNSGCMHNAYCAGDVKGKDPYCASYLNVFEKMRNVLTIEKQKVERGEKDNE